MLENRILKEQGLEEVAIKKSDELVDKARTHMNQLFRQRKNIQKMSSSLHVFMGHSFAEKSFFDRASTWYSEQSWWQSLRLVISIVGVVALIGAAFNVATFIGITALAITICTTTHVLLKQHHTITTTRMQQLAADITLMEQELNEEVQQLCEVEDQLRQVLLELSQEHLRLAQDNAAFEKTIATLNLQITEFTTIIATLTKTKDKLENSQQSLQKQLSITATELALAQRELKLKIQHITNLNTQLSSLTLQLETGAKDLDSIHRHYQERLIALSELETLFSQQLAILTAALAQYTIEEPFDSLLASAEENIRQSALEREEGERLLAEVDSILEYRQHTRESVRSDSIKTQYHFDAPEITC